MIRLSAFLLAVSLSFAAQAETLRLQQNRIELLNLAHDADTVIVADPNVADVRVDTPRRLLVYGVGRGETDLVVLDVAGKELYRAIVSVTGATGSFSGRSYVTVTRGTSDTYVVCGPHCISSPTPPPSGATLTSGGGGPSLSLIPPAAESDDPAKPDVQ